MNFLLIQLFEAMLITRQFCGISGITHCYPRHYPIIFFGSHNHVYRIVNDKNSFSTFIQGNKVQYNVHNISIFSKNLFNISASHFSKNGHPFKTNQPKTAKKSLDFIPLKKEKLSKRILLRFGKIKSFMRGKRQNYSKGTNRRKRLLEMKEKFIDKSIAVR